MVGPSSPRGARPVACSPSPACAAGYEHGEDWHRAGRRANKQNVFDDFHAAADWLVAQRLHLARSLLAIEGGSNGGLLMGAAITQRPDLARAVHCAVPLLDMIRFPQFLIARLWTDEYGDPDVAEEFAWLHAYSPYHHVVDGRGLPGCAVHHRRGRLAASIRCTPARWRRCCTWASSSQDERPILLRQGGRSGHGAGQAGDHARADDADVLSFFCWQLGVETLARLPLLASTTTIPEDHGSISSSPPRRYVWPSVHSLRYGHHRHDTPGFLIARSPSTWSWINRWMPSSVRRSAVRSTPSVTSSTIGCGRVEVEGGQLARRHVADQRFDERVEAKVFAVALADATGLQVDDHLAALAALRLAHHQIDAGTQQDRMVERPLCCGFGGRVAADVERREALGELADPLDGSAAQVGLVAGREGGDPATEVALLVAEAGQRFVDELARAGLAAPVEHQLDGLVGDLALGARRRPFEVVGRQEVHLAVVHAGRGCAW